jgi:hypothetical protein
MLPSENSLTYFNDLIEHYRGVHQRLRNAPFKPKPRAVQAMPAERPGVAPEPEPEPEPPDELAAALAGLDDALTAAILTPHPCTRIINETCLEYGISREEMIGPGRTKHIVRIRQLAMWRCRQAGVSLPKIGRYFGGRDHTTVIHAVRKIEATMREQS